MELKPINILTKLQDKTFRHQITNKKAIQIKANIFQAIIKSDVLHQQVKTLL
jgi:hypothetical protein